MSAATKPLFSLPISSGGAFELTSPESKIYLLTFVSPPDNRVTAPFVKTFSLALDLVEHLCPSGSVLITKSGIEKFYSNGFDIAERQKGGAAFNVKFNALIQRLLT